jgi:hypothetical protein
MTVNAQRVSKPSRIIITAMASKKDVTASQNAVVYSHNDTFNKMFHSRLTTFKEHKILILKFSMQ